MAHTLALIGLPVLFLLDYVAIVTWLLRTSDHAQTGLRFGLRNLLLGITLAAIHLSTITAFMSK